MITSKILEKYQKGLQITANTVYGKLEIQSDVEDKHRIIFHANVIHGNVLLDANKATRDISINHCSFVDIDAKMPVELWFAYANCARSEKAINEMANPLGRESIEIMCRENSTCALTFNLNGNDPIEVVEKCLALLRKNNVTNRLPNI